MSHLNSLASDSRNRRSWTYEDIDELLQKPRALPSPPQQAVNALRYIGDLVLETGEPLEELPKNFRSVIGSPSRDFADQIVTQMATRGLVSAIDAGEMGRAHYVIQIQPTLLGWERYEQEQRGKIAGKYGFMALKFGDQVLDPFLAEVIKPAIAQIGYELFDLRDVARAGVIDNVMREQIRDAAFVLVDLTHANSGAYWEAGYAEGLGKPVLYLCERGVFHSRGTHFDTNHCTTVIWDQTAPAAFSADLVATLRRSLGLF